MEHRDDSHALEAMSNLAERTLSRVSGSPQVGGNYVRLLRDVGENDPAWLDAIKGAKQHIHFESYVIHEDETGQQFSDVLIG